MVCADGGGKKIDGIVPNFSQVRKIIHAVDPSEYKIERLFERHNVKKVICQSGTVRSYCNYFGIFMYFLIASKL